jgi:phospholipid N-methyltransferase
MNGNDLAIRRRTSAVKNWLRRAAGPWGVFIQGFVEHPAMVASVIPSSGFTIRRMLEPVDWPACKLFVEYGPGVGTFCRPILDRLPRDGELIVIDTNPLYIDYLKHTIRDSRFHAVLGSAEDVEEVVRAHGHDAADYVLSGLPFSNLPEGLGGRIVEATHRVLRPGGAFLTYQFSKTARDLTARCFARVETGFEWINVLPCRLAWGWKDEAA